MVTETKYLMGQSAEAMLEAGKRLVQIKENEPWGDFTEIVELRLGINVRSAQKMMQAAVKYLSPKLAAKASPVTLLGTGKLFDLMVEADDDLAELAEGGTLAGHTLAEFEAMTRRELQAALAEARETIRAKERLITKRDERIAAQDERLERPFVPNPKSAARSASEKAMLDELGRCTMAITPPMVQLIAVCDDILNSSVSQSLEVRARQEVVFLAQLLAELLYEHNITIGPDELSLRPAMFEEIDAGLAAKGTSIAQIVEERAAKKAPKKGAKR